MWLSFCKSLQAEMSEASELSTPSSETGDRDDPLRIWHGKFWDDVRGQKHECPECGDPFPTRLSLSTHMKMHQRPICHIYSDEEDLEEHNAQCHAAPPKVPHNSPVLTVLEEEVSEDSGFQTPERNELSFGTVETSTPKRGSAILKRHIRRHALAPSSPHSDLVKRITTRYGRKISSKKRED